MANKARRKQNVVSPGKAGTSHGVKKSSVKDGLKKIVVDEKKLKSIGKDMLNNRKVLGELPNGNIRRQSRRTLKSEDDDSDPELKEDFEMKEDLEIKEEDPEMVGLCEYEKIRLQNIRERQAMFSMLDIQEEKNGFTQMMTPPKKSVPSQRGLVGVSKVKEILPPRKSSRIAGGKVAEIERLVYSATLEHRPGKVKKSPSPKLNKQKIKSTKSKLSSIRFVPQIETTEDEDTLPLTPLSLTESLKDSDENKVSAATSLLAGLAATNKQKTTISTSKSLSSLSLAEERVAKVVPGRIFSIAIHSGSDKLVAAVGGKYGGVGLWDVENNQGGDSHGVHLFKPHVKPVNCISWDLANSNNLVSTSYDGTVRLLDTERQEYTLLYGEEEFLMSGGWTSTHTQVDINTFLVSQGKTGTVALVDRRVTWEKPVNHLKLFDRIHAKSLSLHPLQSHLLLGGNQRGGCFLFDLRNSPSTGLMTPVTILSGHTKTISSAVFSPSGDQIVTMSSDDKIRLYNSSSLGTSSMAPQCQVKHNNQTGRWLTSFRSTWHPSQPNTFLTGSMERPRQIEVWSSSGGNLQLTHRMRSEELNSVCSLMAVHPTRQVVVGGNSSGRVHCFM